MNSTVSVIIPTYNRKEYLKRSIDSVLSQTGPSMELIIVDDGSTDGSAKWITSEYPQVIIIKQDRQGPSAARNRGIESARGEWIAFLDSDDEWLPGKLQAQLELLGGTPDLRVCHAEEIWIRNGQRVNQMKKHAKKGGWIFEHCLPLCRISPSAVMVHRSVFDAVGLFDETYPVCEDYELWLRITAKYEVGFVSEPLIRKYGGHEDQLSHQLPAMDLYRIRALFKTIQNVLLSESQHHAALQEIQSKIKIVMLGARKHQNAAIENELQEISGKLSLKVTESIS